jgi:transposase-like protein
MELHNGNSVSASNPGVLTFIRVSEWPIPSVGSSKILSFRKPHAEQMVVDLAVAEHSPDNAGPVGRSWGAPAPSHTSSAACPAGDDSLAGIARVACPRAGVVYIDGDKPPIFIITDRSTGQRYVIPAKAADELEIRLLLSNRKQESTTAYTDGFRAYGPLAEEDAFDREYVVHGEGEYADDGVQVNTCESHASLVQRWLSPHQGVSKDKLTPHLRALQFQKRVRRKPGDKALKIILETAR